jgi:multidrug efflux pump subunit AcrB
MRQVRRMGLIYYALSTNDQLMTASGFDDYVLGYVSGAPVRVRDVGRAVVAPQDTTLGDWLGSTPTVLLAIQRQPGANVIETVDLIKKALPRLEASIPPSIKVQIVSDRTQTIRASVADVQHTLLLVVGVIFIFLRKLWATVIPAASVPASLIATFAVLYVLGYSLDNLSLMALTIAVGFIVDDAVVMIENIARLIEDGATPMEAAIKGAGEIGFTIVSISIPLIAVFIPLFLMGGIVGLLFREFAVTVAVSIVVSLIVSLTLTPMMSARLLTPEGGNPGSISKAVERFFESLVALYDRELVVALRYRRITLTIMVLTVCLTMAMFVWIPKGFFPQEDTGLILGISEGSQDISPQSMANRQQALLDEVSKDPAVVSAVGYIGPGGATVTKNGACSSPSSRRGRGAQSTR